MSCWSFIDKKDEERVFYIKKGKISVIKSSRNEDVLKNVEKEEYKEIDISLLHCI